jgi:hypothetical protein
VLATGAIAGDPSSVEVTANSVLGRLDGNIEPIDVKTSLAQVFDLHDSLASAKSIKSYIDDSVSSPFIPQGGYDASTNTPNLDNWGSNNGYLKGYIWIVTAPGTFFSEGVVVGDYVIANKLNPILYEDWTVVHNDLNNATESVPGIVEIATEVEAKALALDSVVITPLKLKAVLGVTNTISTGRKFSAPINPTGTTALTYTISHGLATSDVVVSVRDTASPYHEVGTEVKIINENSITIGFNVAPAANKYKVTIIG